MKIRRCTVCNYIHRGEEPPARCPVCNAPAGKFVEIDASEIPEKNPGIGGKQPSPESGKAKSGEKEGPDTEETLFEKIKTLLVKHHAHPVSVHTPNGILPAAVLLWLVAWIFNSALLSGAAFINLIIVIIAMPFVIFTGVIEWQRKYNGALTMLFKLKIIAASLTCATAVIIFFWYLLSPDVLNSGRAWAFILVNILMVAAAGGAGFIGGKLVFRD